MGQNLPLTLLSRIVFPLMSTVLAVAALEGASDFHERLADAKQAAVRIVVPPDSFVGSGFFLNSAGYIATCSHVLRIGDKKSKKYYSSVIVENFVWVPARDGNGQVQELKRISANVVAYEPRMDVAILKVDVLRAPYMALMPFDSLKEGDDVMLVSFLDDLKNFPLPRAFASRGMISTLRPNEYIGDLDLFGNFIFMDLNNARGTSGGLVLSIEKNKVVGMQLAGVFDDSTDIVAPCAVALAADHIITVAKKYRIQITQ